MRKGDYYNSDISSLELATILEYCNQLKDLYEKEGLENLFYSKKMLIIDDAQNIEDINKLLNIIENSPNGKEILSKFVELTSENVSSFIDNNPNINEVIELLKPTSSDNLYYSLKGKFINTDYLKDNINNSNEEFWQKLKTLKIDVMIIVL